MLDLGILEDGIGTRLPQVEEGIAIEGLYRMVPHQILSQFLPHRFCLL
jgi:hypothetical protein